MMYKLKLSDLTSLALRHHQEMFTACWATAQGTGKSRGRVRRVGGGRGHPLRPSGSPEPPPPALGLLWAKGPHNLCLPPVTQKQVTRAALHGDPPEAPRKARALHKTEKGLPRIFEIFPLKMGLFPEKLGFPKE